MKMYTKMKLVNIIFEDDIVAVWKKGNGDCETYRYNFFGYPNGNADYAVRAPRLPVWVLSHAESFRNNNNVCILQIAEFTEDDFKHLLELYKSRHPDGRELYEDNIVDVMRTPDIAEYWLADYLKDFIGDAG